MDSSGQTKYAGVEDILQRMRAGVKEVYEIRLREMIVPVRILSIDEVNAIRREAIRHQAVVQGDETDKNVHIQKTTLKLASTLSKGGGPVLSDKVLEMVTVDELNFLYNEYVNVMDRVNPTLETIPPEHFRLLVDALKKNGASPRELSLHQLRAICSAFQDMIQRQETVSSQQVN